jgi:hypothetical protein
LIKGIRQRFVAFIAGRRLAVVERLVGHRVGRRRPRLARCVPRVAGWAQTMGFEKAAKALRAASLATAIASSGVVLADMCGGIEVGSRRSKYAHGRVLICGHSRCGDLHGTGTTAGSSLATSAACPAKFAPTSATWGCAGRSRDSTEACLVDDGGRRRLSRACVLIAGGCIARRRPRARRSSTGRST